MNKFIVRLLTHIGDFCLDLADSLDHDLHKKLLSALTEKQKYKIVPIDDEAQP